MKEDQDPNYDSQSDGLDEVLVVVSMDAVVNPVTVMVHTHNTSGGGYR